MKVKVVEHIGTSVTRCLYYLLKLGPFNSNQNFPNGKKMPK